MSRKAKVEAEKTRKRILASALSLFTRQGYDRTTFTDIAARLKMTKGAVYWHFETKEALLIALVDEMLAKFRRQMEELTPKEGLTFLTMTEVMVANAERILGDPKGIAFFMLMKTQVKWGADSMRHVREELLSNRTQGPFHALIAAVENDQAAGRVRKEVNPVEVASVCIAVWDGLVQARIESFLGCELVGTLRRAYAAVWESIRI